MAHKKSTSFATDAFDILSRKILLVFKKEKFRTNKTKPLKDIGPYFGTVIDNLKFELTNAQKNVVKDIHFDLKKDSQMNRLIQGDVGCGKTIVAILISAIAIGNNVQVAIMAPTEILANQHFQGISELLEGTHIKCALLTGSVKKSARKPIHEQLESGELNILIGTHALLEDKVKYQNLGIAILGIFIPPLAVYLYEDAITANFWVNLLLTLLFWIPGIVFAMLVIFADVSV